MPNVARSQLPLITFEKNGVSVGDDLIFGSGSLNISKRITRNVTMAGVKRRIISVSAAGAFTLDGDATETMNTDATNPGAGPGNQDILTANGVIIAGVVTASFDLKSNLTSCQFRGSLPEIDDLASAGVVSGTDAETVWEAP